MLRVSPLVRWDFTLWFTMALSPLELKPLRRPGNAGPLDFPGNCFVCCVLPLPLSLPWNRGERGKLATGASWRIRYNFPIYCLMILIFIPFDDDVFPQLTTNCWRGKTQELELMGQNRKFAFQFIHFLYYDAIYLLLSFFFSNSSSGLKYNLSNHARFLGKD